MQPYHFVERNAIVNPQNGTLHFEDLTGNGVYERILQRSYYGKVPTLRIAAADYFISELRLEGEWASGESIFFGDLDSDGVKELLTFTILRDSLLVSVCNMHQVLNQFFIIKLDPTLSFKDYLVSVGGVHQNQFYFSLNAGYSEKPRGVFRLDLTDGTVISTKTHGAIAKNPYFFDLDADGEPEIVTKSMAPANIHHDVPYTDSSAWLMVFDLGLNFFFPPVQYPINHGQTDVHPFKTDSGNFLAVSYTFSDQDRPIKQISLYDDRGEEILTEKSRFSKILIPLNNSLFAVDVPNEQVHLLDHRLVQKDLLVDNLPITSSRLLIDDFFGDAKSEVGIICDKTFVVLASDLRSRIEYEMDTPIQNIVWSSGSFFVTTEFEVFEIQVEEKPWHSWRFLFILAAVGLVVLIFRVRNAADYTTFNTQKEQVKIFHQDIYYLEADGSTTRIFSADHHPFVFTKNMGAVEDMIPIHMFLKTHRSFYVRKDLITSLNKSNRTVKLKTPAGTYDIKTAKDRFSDVEEVLAH